MRSWSVVGTFLALVPTAAHAEALALTTREYRSWPEAVASLQADVHGEGHLVHVGVRDEGGRAMPCSDYSLTLDAVATQAFVVEGCDADTRTTVLRLVSRGALFDHDDVPPRPRVAGITAVAVRTGGAAGGAANVGGSELACSAGVRPFMNDLESGRRVFLTPGRYVLRPRAADIRVVAESDGWTLRGGGHASVTVEYDVLDAERHEIVVHDRATLACGTEHLGEGVSPAVPSSAVVTQAVAMPVLATRVSTGDTAADGAPAQPEIHPPHPRTAVLFSMGFLGLEATPMADVMLNGGGTADQRRGADALFGLDVTARPPTGLLGVTFEVPYFLAFVGGGWRTNGTTVGVDARVTAAAAFRIGSAMLYGGPTGVGWYVSTQDVYDRAWQTSFNVALGGTLGFRWNFESWSAEDHRFTVGDLFIEASAAPLGASTFGVVLGGSIGVGH